MEKDLIQASDAVEQNPVITGQYIENPMDKKSVRSGDIFTLLEVKRVRNERISGGTPKYIFVTDKGEVWANWTSVKNIMASWGNNTLEWRNKKIKVEIKSQYVEGKDRDVFYFTPTEA